MRPASAMSARLPREFGWVGRMLPEAAKYAGALQYLLRDPETMALVAKAPQAGRMLRPLCHLLGVRPPEFLRRGAVAAQETPTPIGVEAPRAELAMPSPAPEPLKPPTAEEGAEVAQPPPKPGHAPAEEAALAYARRPGGLYWDGTRMRWS